MANNDEMSDEELPPAPGTSDGAGDEHAPAQPPPAGGEISNAAAAAGQDETSPEIPVEEMVAADLALDQDVMPITQSQPPIKSDRIVWASAICASISLVWLLVSLDVSLEYFLGMATGLRLLLPDVIVESRPYRFLLADVTSASPLVVLLTVAIPGWVGRTRAKRGKVPRWCVDGYPRGWITFVIYVGLAATLFGMFEALSAVSTEQAVSPKEQLSQLIAGTATALVSSLVALVAGFIAHLFKRAVHDAGWLAETKSINFDDELLQLKERFTDLDACVLGLIDPVDELSAAIAEVKNEFQNLGLVDPLDNLRGAISGLHGELEQLSRTFEPLRGEMEPLLKLLSGGNQTLENLHAVAAESLDAHKLMVSRQSEQLTVERGQLAAQQARIELLGEQVEIDKQQLATSRESLALQQALLDAQQGQGERYAEQVASSKRQVRMQRRQLKMQKDQFAWFGDEAQNLLGAMKTQLELQEKSYYVQIRVLTALRSMVSISEKDFEESQSERESRRRAARAQLFEDSTGENGTRHQPS